MRAMFVLGVGLSKKLLILMNKLSKKIIDEAIKKNVEDALSEDIRKIDLSENIIMGKKKACGVLMAKQSAVLCGSAWFNKTFSTLNKNIQVKWLFKDGDYFKKGSKLCEIKGPYQDLLKGERVAINFIQTLSSVATNTHELTALIKNFPTKIYDTRKTIPGLRIAQKYAVLTGGGNNQRLGLFDQVLIKENHINAFDNLENLLKQLKKLKLTNKIQIEIENINDLKLALAYDVKNILLDNFSIKKIREAIEINQKKALLEASGNITKKNIIHYAKTGVDRISLGTLTKNIKAIDFSVIIHPF